MSLNRIKEFPQAIKEIKKRITDLSQKVPIGAINEMRNTPNDCKMRQKNRNQSDVEVIDITDDEEEEESSNLKKKLSLRVTTDDEAADVSIVIQALKESVVKYLSKIPTKMRRVLINKVMDDEDVIDLDLNL